MNRNVLRRKALFNYSPHLVFSDRCQRGVISVKKREPYIFIFDEEGGSCVRGIAVAKTENALISTLARNDLLKAQPKILAFAAFDLQFPIFTRTLANLQKEFRFPGRLKAKVEIVAYCTTINLSNSVSRLEFQFRPKALRRDCCYLDSPAANTGNCGSYCKFVHARIMSDKLYFVEEAQHGGSDFAAEIR